MKLRFILILLSVLVCLSALLGGYLYFQSLFQFAAEEGYRQGAERARMIQNHLASFLTENRKTVRVLAGLKETRSALMSEDPQSLAAANAMLDYFKDTLMVDVCYIMDRSGTTIATSNRNDPDSFLHRNFAFRPYFQEAIAGGPGIYMAIGTTSKKRGVYYAFPVYGPTDPATPIGAAVIKAPVAPLEQQFLTETRDTVMLADPHGIVFVSNVKKWLFLSLWKLTPEAVEQIRQSRQFGNGPWTWTGLTKKDDHTVADRQGHEYLYYHLGLETQPGWEIVYLITLRSLSQSVVAPLLHDTGPVVLILCVLVVLTVSFLYHKASHEIRQRKRIEDELRKSEARYRTLYHRTPALMHSVGPDGRLISVSDYWLAALGYQREEVIGQHLTVFLTEQSRRYALEAGIPNFFATGTVTNVSYQFVRKDESLVDVLLSAISERDDDGNIVRSLAVLLDVTEQKRDQENLREAREKLSHYSRELEKQVARRTAEFSGILNHTPSVIAMKDLECRYVLINRRFEELFGVSHDDIRGKTDHDLFSPEVAGLLRANDQRVLNGLRPVQIEERMPQVDGMHAYLSVKFPVLDENGRPYRLCAISMDITELTKMQNQLRRLSAAVIADQEKERAGLARELHDELGQLLTALRFDAVWLRERLPENDTRAAERARAFLELIDTTLDEVRNLALRLRPRMLDTLGLVDALQWHTTDFEKRSGVSCALHHGEVSGLTDEVTITAYRIAQEALTNVARHARARQVTINLETDENLLKLQVLDDGDGFEVSQLKEAEGLGVAGMRERAMLLGGRLEIDSSPGRGTRLSCILPIMQGGFVR